MNTTAAPRLDPSASRPRPARWRWWLAGAVIALGALAAATLGRVRARQLPPLPDLAGRPPALAQAVRAAHAEARALLDPAPGVTELGRLYHANGYEGEAAVCWERLREAQPREGRWCYYLADLRRTAGDDRGMVAQLQAALERDPTYAPAWLRSADFAFKTGRLDDAGTAYRRRLELLPRDPYARLGLARVALQRDRPAEGKAALEELVRDVPEFPSAHNVYAELLARDGDAAGAARQRWLGTVAERFREAEDPWLLELRARCYDPYQLLIWGAIEVQTKQVDRGRELFERALRLAPDDPRPYEELGQLHLQSGEPAKARELLERGLALARFSEKLHTRLSATYRTLDQPAAALALDQRGLAQAPESVELLNSLGLSQTALGQLVDAEATFRAALRRAPNAADPLMNLGRALLLAGRRAEARQTWEHALAINPQLPAIVTLLAGLELEDGRLDSAARLIRPYFDQYPGLNTARTLLTQWYLQTAITAVKSGDPAAAERACQEGIAEIPEAAELHGMVGGLYLQRQQVPEALAAMEACRRLRPGDPRAVLQLARLYVDLRRVDDARRVLSEARDWARQNGASEAVTQLDAILRTLPP